MFHIYKGAMGLPLRFPRQLRVIVKHILVGIYSVNGLTACHCSYKIIEAMIAQ